MILLNDIGESSHTDYRPDNDDDDDDSSSSYVKMEPDKDSEILPNWSSCESSSG